MTTLARKTLVVAAVLAVLVAPHPAWAACAWVLWSNYGTLDPNVPLTLSTVKVSPSRWQPRKAFDTAQACETALGQEERHEWNNLLFKRNENKPKGEVWDAWAFSCLPDTVDPRGPKGGER